MPASRAGISAPVRTPRGRDIDAACGQLAFTLAADADFFLTVAKFRALRQIFARAAEVEAMKKALKALRIKTKPHP